MLISCYYWFRGGVFTSLALLQDKRALVHDGLKDRLENNHVDAIIKRIE